MQNGTIFEKSQNIFLKESCKQKSIDEIKKVPQILRG